MSEEAGSEHCYIQRILTPEERDRVREFLRQQGIHLPEAQLIGVIGEPGDRKDCPFRFGVGEWTQYCSNVCHLGAVFGDHPAKD